MTTELNKDKERKFATLAGQMTFVLGGVYCSVFLVDGTVARTVALLVGVGLAWGGGKLVARWGDTERMQKLKTIVEPFSSQSVVLLIAVVSGLAWVMFSMSWGG